jgi:hypothetical protein
MITSQHLPLEQGPVEGALRENGHIGHRDQSSFEDVRTPSTGALDIYTSGTWVRARLLIASVSSPPLRY